MARDHRRAVRCIRFICQENVKGQKTLRKAAVRGQYGNLKMLAFNLHI